MRNMMRLFALVGVALIAPLASCNDPLRVSIPDIVQPGQLSDSAALATVRAGALGDFDIAYTGDHPDGSGGTGEGVIMYGGLLADEWINSETFPTRIEVDARTIQLTNSDVDLWYRLLHRARHSAEVAAGRYAKFAPSGDPGYPEVLTLAGLTYIFFAETYCSGVPVSHLNDDGSITYGIPLTSVQLLDTAIARLDSALAVSSDPDMTNFATVEKARALMDRGAAGDFAAAGALAAAVPTSFVYLRDHSENTDRENNGVYTGNVVDLRYSVADGEGVNGFPFRSVADPRTPSFRPGGTAKGFDRSTPQWDNLRYANRSGPVTVATGVEARLIEAEAAYRAGDSTNVFLTKLNDPRGDPAGRAYFDPGAAAAVGTLPNLTLADETAAGGAVNLLFAERARWLWLTAHRLGDLRRLVRQYGRAESAVFPTGPYFKVNFATYGTDVNIPVPITEQNNPNFTGCLDRLP
jgi:hypothetical protein